MSLVNLSFYLPADRCLMIEQQAVDIERTWNGVSQAIDINFILAFFIPYILVERPILRPSTNFKLQFKDDHIGFIRSIE